VLSNESLFARDPLPPNEQDERIEAYLIKVQKHCTRCATEGLPQVGLIKRMKKFKRVTFSNTWDYLDLDEEHKKTLLERIAQLYVSGKPVKLFFPKKGETFSFGVRW
jgi:hypothetical protein